MTYGLIVLVGRHDFVGLHVLLAGVQHEDERVPDVTRIGVVLVETIWHVRDGEVDQLHGRDPDGARVSLPAGESCGVCEERLRPVACVPVQVDGELDVSAARHFFAQVLARGFAGDDACGEFLLFLQLQVLLGASL